MSENFVEKTQKELGAVIKAPKLTEKLLGRPPFRFIHDIITNFITSNNFPVGLYTPELLDSAKVTTKESKMEFLELLIKAVEAATGQSCPAKASKIIAGVESENTNQLLQLLASCAALPDATKTAAVAKVTGKTGEASAGKRKSTTSEVAAPAPPPVPAPPASAEPAPASAAPPSPKRKKSRSGASREAQGSVAATSPPAPARSRHRRAPEPEIEEEPRVHNDAVKEATEEGVERNPPSSAAAATATPPAPAPITTAVSRESAGEKAEPTSRTSRHSRASPVSSPAHPKEQQRTVTAGRAPPRAKPTHEVIPATGAAPLLAAGLIAESAPSEAAAGQNEDGADDWLSVAERAKGGSRRMFTGDAGEDADGVELKGRLGQKAMRAKQEQEEARRAREAAVLSGEGGIVIRGGNRAGTRFGGAVGTGGGAALSEMELQKLQEQLQLLTKAANPLGKFLEAIYDDLDSMSRELETWRSEAHNQALAAAEAERQTQESVQALQVQLQGLEDAIQDQIVKTNHLHQTILTNDLAIEGMVQMIVGQESMD